MACFFRQIIVITPEKKELTGKNNLNGLGNAGDAISLQSKATFLKELLAYILLSNLIR